MIDQAKTQNGGNACSPEQVLNCVKGVAGAYKLERQRAAEAEETCARLECCIRELERKNKELKEFAYIVSHDLQAPLNKIVAFGNLLQARAETMDAETRDYLQRMRKAALHMREFTAAVLRISLAGCSGSRPFGRVRLEKVVGEAQDDLEELLRETGGIATVASLPAVWGDKVQLRQLFLNLLGNALKFRKPGTPPRVAVDGAPARDREGFWEISVRDNGVGFDEKYADRIFKPFERLNGNRFEGTGIGLSICEKVVSRHGGTIAVRSKLGEGTTFVVSLPEARDGASLTAPDGDAIRVELDGSSENLEFKKSS